jgi:hypothetical protein
VRVRIDFIWLWIGSCEHGNKPSGFIKGEEFVTSQGLLFLKIFTNQFSLQGNFSLLKIVYNPPTKGGAASTKVHLLVLHKLKTSTNFLRILTITSTQAGRILELICSKQMCTG